MVIWHKYQEAGSQVETVRVAEWTAGRKLAWHLRFTGNEPLQCEVISQWGGWCLISEWKSPEDASGVLYRVCREGTGVVGVGSYGGSASMQAMRIGYDVKDKCVVIGQRSGKRMKFSLLMRNAGTSVLEEESEMEVADFAFLNDDCRQYIVLQVDGTAVVRCIRWPSVR
jgi:hypothetical protein